MFLVTKYEYATARNDVIRVFSDRGNAANYIQEYVIDYVKNQDGAEKITNEYRKGLAFVLSARIMKLDYLSPNRIKVYLTGLPIGHYVIADCDDHLFKWTIWYRGESKIISRGRIWNTETIVPVIRKVFDIDLLSISDKMNTNLSLEFLTSPQLSPAEEGPEAREAWYEFSQIYKTIPAILAIREQCDKGEMVLIKDIYTKFNSDFGKYIPRPATMMESIIMDSVIEGEESTSDESEENEEILEKTKYQNDTTVNLHKKLALEAMAECKRRQIPII